ncbi:MAG TPA: phosphoglycolate phosphatase [Rubrivivax sp.]|jgi:2-phosphoglycolate phosphatase|nr:phosphoglycolate phosphatase [Rubrivivax sp.]
MRRRFDAVLFDLDGTLADSAPDLAGAANEQRVAHGLPALPLEALRPHVGSGARGMLAAAFDLRPGQPAFEPMKQDFLRRYEARMLAESVLFEDVRALIDALTSAGTPWGVVTNKSHRLASVLMAGLGLQPVRDALVGGDSTPFTKPHPEPLFEATRRLQVDPARCVFVGDDVRDITAGRAAGMATVVAAWGYLGVGEPAERWGADAIMATPADLSNWLA